MSQLENGHVFLLILTWYFPILDLSFPRSRPPTWPYDGEEIKQLPLWTLTCAHFHITFYVHYKTESKDTALIHYGCTPFKKWSTLKWQISAPSGRSDMIWFCMCPQK